MSVLERCPSYKESNKESKKRQEPTLSVHFTEVSVKREWTVLYSTHLSRAPPLCSSLGGRRKKGRGSGEREKHEKGEKGRV